MLDLRRLRLLVELRRRGTIAAVGEALHYSPSGVSQQLGMLESESGVKLLERVGRRVQLTRAAEVLCEHAELMLQEAERAEAAIAAVHSSAAGHVRIAAFQTFNLTMLPPLIESLGALDITVAVTQLEPERAMPALRDNHFDVVIAEGYGDRRPEIPLDLRSLVVMREHLYLAVPDALAGSVTCVDDAADLPWVMEPATEISRGWAVGRCRAAGFEPHVQFEADDMLTHVALIRSGNAVGFLPAIIYECTSLEGVTLLPIHDQYRRIKAITRRQSVHYPTIVTTVEEIRVLGKRRSR